jgi:hypothetical protein
MKRSFILNEIYRLLHCGPDYPTEDEILTMLENFGMSPPGILKKDGSPHQEYYYPYGQPVSEWEPEDETL